MKLEKAIELLQQELNDPGSVLIVDILQAQKLGYEALKAIIVLRNKTFYPSAYQLPGETED